jgi:hypothetical protein
MLADFAANHVDATQNDPITGKPEKIWIVTDFEIKELAEATDQVLRLYADKINNAIPWIAFVIAWGTVFGGRVLATVRYNNRDQVQVVREPKPVENPEPAKEV